VIGVLSSRPRVRSLAPALPRATALAAWALGAGTVLSQIVYSTTDPAERTPLTVLTVLTFCAASVLDAWTRCGARAAVALVAVAGGGGLLAEVVGLHTGFPFGDYGYTDALGASVLGVPVVVPLAWVMMAWPALLVGRALAGNGPRAALVAAWALAAWDVFLDPQMVDAGYWTWSSPEPSLPGVAGVPLTNFAGWLLVSLAVQFALRALVPPAGDGPLALRAGPAPVLYVWTWFSSVWAHAAFFDRPAVSLVGGLLMGAVAVPFAVAVVRGQR
jgi:putative membrane protein